MCSCDEVKKKLERYIDNELSPQEASKIEEHIKNCDSCRSELEFCLSVRNALKDIKLPDPPADFLDRVYDKLNTLPIETKRFKFDRFLNWRSYSTIAACLLVAVFLGVNADEFRQSLTPRQEVTVGDSSAPPESVVGDRSISDDLHFENIPEEGTPEPALEGEADAPAQASAAPQDDLKKDTSKASTPIPEIKAEDNSESVKKSIWDIFVHTPSSQPSGAAAENNAPAEVQQPEATATPAPTQQVQPRQNNENQSQTSLYSQETSSPGSSAANSLAPEANNSLQSQDNAEDADSGEPMLESVPEAASITSDEASADTLPGGGSGCGSSSASSGGASAPAGGGSSAGTHRKSSDGEVSVPAEDLVNARNTAMHYGSYENGIFGMTAEKFDEFLTALDEAGIDFSVSFTPSGAVRFEIIAK